MKKLLSMVLTMAMVSALAVPVFAEETTDAPKLGEATVNVTKVWDDNENEAEARPESVTVTVGDNKVVLNEAKAWTDDVVVDVFNADGTLATYDVDEVTVENYETAIDNDEVVMKGFTGYDVLDPVRNCESLQKYLDGRNVAIFKKGYEYKVWSEVEWTESAKVAFVNAVKAVEAYGEDFDGMVDPEFVVGYGTFKLWDQDVTIAEDGTIEFEGKATWSWFYRGTVALDQDDCDITVTNTYVEPEGPEEPEVDYVWKQTGSDSATGLSDNKVNAKKSWFMYNKVDEMEVGDTQTFDIQAGNNKNGLNIVGSYTVTKVGENEYTITFAANEPGETSKVELDGAKLWVNNTGVFENSPGNQKGKAEAVEAGETFEFNGDTLYVFAHFEATYWELVPVEVVE